MDENLLTTKLTAGKDLSYVEVLGSNHLLGTYDDAVDLISLCMSNHVDHILIHDKVLSDDFFRLRTGVAGIFLQKFVNYSIIAAIILGEKSPRGAALLEMIGELNKGDQIRFFEDEKDAGIWLSTLAN